MILDTLLYNFRSLFPSGRAFKIIDFGVKENLLRGISLSFIDWINYINEINEQVIPDSDNLTPEQATDWERRIGLFVKPNNPIDIRQDAILRKYGQRGTVLGKNSSRYIERELQRAGFNVNVFENFFPDGMGGYETRPLPSLGFSVFFGQNTFQSTSTFLGDQSIGTSANIVANSIDPLGADAGFILSTDDLPFTFFIAGDTYDQQAQVPRNRENEFRQLIIALKPTHAVALLNLIYV